MLRFKLSELCLQSSNLFIENTQLSIQLFPPSPLCNSLRILRYFIEFILKLVSLHIELHQIGLNILQLNLFLLLNLLCLQSTLLHILGGYLNTCLFLSRIILRFLLLLLLLLPRIKGHLLLLFWRESYAWCILLGRLFGSRVLTHLRVLF